jgi:HK97 family phage prohead protease
MKEAINKNLEKEVKSIDEQQGIVQFYANAFNNIDADGDVSLPGSFTKTLSENLGRMRWLLNHDIDKLLGVPFIDGGMEDSFGLISTNKANMDKVLAKDTFQDYLLYKKYNRTLEHSVRVSPIKYETVEKEGIPIEWKEQAYGMGYDRIRIVKEWRLMEVSTVMWGANEKTPLLDIKSLNNLDNTIKYFETMLSMNYTDERMKSIEDTYNILKSLKNEPLKSTGEPDEDTRLEPILDIFKKSKLFGNA